MDTLLIGNGRVITRDAENPYLEDGCVYVQGDIIKEVGSTAQLRAKHNDAQWVDAKGGVIMPGLINTHNHIYSAMARGLSIHGYSPRDFNDILEGQWWRIDRLLTPEQNKYSALATYIDCIKNGATTVFDHHASYGSIEGSLFTIAEAAKQLGVRSCLCYEVSDRDGEDRMKAAVKENVDFINYAEKESLRADGIGRDKLLDVSTDNIPFGEPQGGAQHLSASQDVSSDFIVRGTLGLHAPFTLSNKTLEYCAAMMPEDVGYHIHVAEGIGDVYDSLQKYGKRTVQRLLDMDILGEKTIAVHCIHINEAEMDILKATNTMVVHNPESNMGNAVGCGPVMRMFQKDILLGLGTDGYTNDMLESYKVGNIIHKHHLCNPNAAWGEMPHMLFHGNASIAGRYFPKPLGVLKPGAYADIIATDYIPLTPMNADNCNSHILFGMNGRSVTTTIIAGKILMQDGRLTMADEQQVLAKSREEAAKLWQAINSR